jgi:hypothetical protein
VVGFLGVAIFGLGLEPILSRGDLFYRNHFGMLVFAPIAIIFGLVIIFGALFKPGILGKSRNNPRG